MMKYVVLRNLDAGSEHMYLFHKDEVHSHVATTLCAAFKHDRWTPARGGYVRLSATGLKCWGEAISLGVYSDPKKDTEMLAKMLEP
jgi:hypothetical protein